LKWAVVVIMVILHRLDRIVVEIIKLMNVVFAREPKKTKRNDLKVPIKKNIAANVIASILLTIS
jgi:hypothetical protein